MILFFLFDNDRYDTRSKIFSINRFGGWEYGCIHTDMGKLGGKGGRSRKEQQLGKGVMREGEMLMVYAHACDV